jgi:hypothetical protein
MATDGPDHIIKHLHEADAQAVIVVDGSADGMLAELLAAGWTWAQEPAVLCSGKRIRHLRLPTSETE